MKISKMIEKLTKLKITLEQLGLEDVIIDSIFNSKDYRNIENWMLLKEKDEIFISSAIKDKEGKIFIRVQSSNKKILQELNILNLLRDIRKDEYGYIYFNNNTGLVDLIIINDTKWYDEEATEFAKKYILDAKNENLCPDCKVYCEKRFVDGRCE